MVFSLGGEQWPGSKVMEYFGLDLTVWAQVQLFWNRNRCNEGHSEVYSDGSRKESGPRFITFHKMICRRGFDLLRRNGIATLKIRTLPPQNLNLLVPHLSPPTPFAFTSKR